MLTIDRSFWNKGSSKIKVFIVLLIIAAVLFVGYTFGIAYYDHWSIGESVDEQLGLYNTWRGALNTVKPTQQGIRDKIKKMATDKGFTFEDKDIQINQDSNDKLSCEIKFKKKLNFLVYEYDIEFNHAYSPKDFEGKKVTQIL